MTEIRTRVFVIATASLDLMAGIFILGVITPQQIRDRLWHAL